MRRTCRELSSAENLSGCQFRRLFRLVRRLLCLGFRYSGQARRGCCLLWIVLLCGECCETVAWTSMVPPLSCNICGICFIVYFYFLSMLSGILRIFRITSHATSRKGEDQFRSIGFGGRRPGLLPTSLSVRGVKELVWTAWARACPRGLYRRTGCR